MIERWYDGVMHCLKCGKNNFFVNIKNKPDRVSEKIFQIKNSGLCFVKKFFESQILELFQIKVE
jgi:hypothetical protein